MFDEPDPENDLFNYVGEIASHPFDKLANLINFTDRYYPEKTNKFCGLHYHIKPKNIFEYQMLNTKRFYLDFLRAIAVFGESRGIAKTSEFWKRLNGHNDHYCKRQFHPYIAKDGEDPERYTVINYCFRKHGTVEFGLFPCFQSKKLSLEALRFTHDFVNTWLCLNLKKNKLKLKRTIILDEVKK